MRAKHHDLPTKQAGTNHNTAKVLAVLIVVKMMKCLSGNDSIPATDGVNVRMTVKMSVDTRRDEKAGVAAAVRGNQGRDRQPKESQGEEYTETTMKNHQLNAGE